MAYLALFQIATFKGWIDIMDDAIDMVTVRFVTNNGPSFIDTLFTVK